MLAPRGRGSDRVGGVALTRHFTVTAFVSTPEATLLHWHRKVGLWLPPGGHIEPDEDPVDAALRETLEETGLAVEILPTAERCDFAEPEQVPAPVTIMLEPIGPSDEGDAHQHIDMIYFARPVRDAPGVELGQPWRWVSREMLISNETLPADTAGGVEAEISEDVRTLGIASIDRSAAEEAA